MFNEDPAPAVAAAVKSLIATRTNNFPPNIGEVKEALQKLREPDPITEQAAWAIVSKAVRDCDLQYPKRTFDTLPPEIQRAVGSPGMLLSWAMTEENAFQTVVASNFQRSFRALKKRQWEFAKMPADVKNALAGFAGGMELPSEGEYKPLTEGEFNDKRNEAVALLAKSIAEDKGAQA